MLPVRIFFVIVDLEALQLTTYLSYKYMTCLTKSSPVQLVSIYKVLYIIEKAFKSSSSSIFAKKMQLFSQQKIKVQKESSFFL